MERKKLHDDGDCDCMECPYITITTAGKGRGGGKALLFFQTLLFTPSVTPKQPRAASTATLTRRALPAPRLRATRARPSTTGAEVSRDRHGLNPSPPSPEHTLPPSLRTSCPNDTDSRPPALTHSLVPHPINGRCGQRRRGNTQEEGKLQEGAGGQDHECAEGRRRCVPLYLSPEHALLKEMR